ncbi:tetratricopeptide repeat protein [Rheinheimera maricola]|uniref:Tetratricopeptide repeat protein n=1 Tax=Rheinheimera maricola TaxID=2793282 RepID=A0ABS7XB73_9GAMM|nr:tetratricopeptide repeat protein [Rheinheimera maricola]MBZ9612804.1 tetratricopeptide repeat protein [Rheinheimera maricola]
MQQNSPAKLFQSALTYYQQRQFAPAAALCNKILQIAPHSADAMHLMALCTAHSEPKQAEQYFERAIQAAQANTTFKKSYANFLLTSQRYTEALALYQPLQALNPADTDISYGIAFVHYQQQRYRAALSLIDKTSVPDTSAAKWLTLKARALIDCGKPDDAVRSLDQALKLTPDNSGLTLTKILALRQLQQPQQALDCFQQLPDSATTRYLAGCLYYDLQQYDVAEQQLLQALALQPDYIDAHAAINKLYWEHSNSTQFLSSFQRALIAIPNSTAVYLSYISHLLMAERLEAAIAVTNQAIQHCGKQHQLLHALGTLHCKQNQIDKAMPLFQQALAQAPNSVRYQLDNANCLLKAQQYHAALPLLQQARQIAPDNQEVWAYLGLCWRLMADPQHNWLNNYSQFISVKKLPTPAGYESFAAFWQELKTAVNALHTTDHQPLDQSVRNGTQTVGFLFNNPAGIVQIYRDLLTEHLQQYLAALPSDPDHPLLRRITSNQRFSGSWSVKLRNDGFHTNHVHPQGWLSICTYLHVPETISATDPQHQGWLKLGETSLQLGEREQIARSICPEEGLCVIFPSYIWHGTVPFNGDDARITLPCDVVPDI